MKYLRTQRLARSLTLSLTFLIWQLTHSLTDSHTDLLQVIGHLLGLGWLARTWTRLDATSVDSIKEYYGQARHYFL